MSGYCTLSAILSKISKKISIANYSISEKFIIFADMNDELARNDLRELLFSEAQRINNQAFIAADPVQFPRRFTSLPDIEIAALLASTISWGNRKAILKDCERLLGLMDGSPHAWCMDRAYEALDDDMNLHRTFFARNLKHYMRALRGIYTRYPSLDAYAAANRVGQVEAPSYRLAELLGREIARANDGVPDTRCLPQNLRTTPLKRLNMAMRWLVRTDGIVDLGVWQSVKPRSLYIPLDVHSADTARKLGLIRRRSNDRMALLQLMQAVRPMRPEDPAFFDFALFGIGMGL